MKRTTWIAVGVLMALASVAVSVLAAPAKRDRARLQLNQRKIVRKFVYREDSIRERPMPR